MDNEVVQRKNMPEKEDVSILTRNASSSSRKHPFLTSLKITIIILCLVGFFFNSYMIFKRFIGNETVTSMKVQENKELFLPSMTLCGVSGFKRIVDKYSDLKLENYFNNTIHLDEMLIEAFDNDQNAFEAEPINKPIFAESDVWKITTTLSAYRGRCYTIEYRKKVCTIVQGK